MTQKYIQAIRDYIKEKGQEKAKTYELTPEEVRKVKGRARIRGKAGMLKVDGYEAEKIIKYDPIPEDLPLGEYLDNESETPEEEEERLRLEREQLDLHDEP
jgi:hypothetical protein